MKAAQRLIRIAALTSLLGLGPITDQSWLLKIAIAGVATTNSTRIAQSNAGGIGNVHLWGGYARWSDLRFSHLTTKDGLSQSAVTTVLQDRRGFIWIATRDGLNRYDGNAFVVYKNKADDPASLSSNLVDDLIEDDQGYLWIATYTGGVNKFDPATEGFTHYRHDPNNSNSLSADSVNTIARDGKGLLWIGTEASGLDKFDPAAGTFTHYLNDSDGHFVGRITKVIEGHQGDIWFVGERGLFHLDRKTEQITRPPGITNDLGADYVYEDEIGNLWMLAYSPIVGLIKYDRQKERLFKYPVGPNGVGLVSSKLFADGQKGIWVPSSLGLYYFDRATEHLAHLFEHLDSNPDGLNDNAVVSIYRDKGGVLWVGTESGGLNILNLRQTQFGRYTHRPGDPNSLSPGRVTAIYQESKSILWVGFSPHALDRLDRKTGQVTHYAAGLEDRNVTEKGTDVNSIYKDSRGYLWLGGWGSGLDRLDERTGEFKHYRHNPADPNSLPSNHVLRIYGDRSGQLWVGHIDGVARLDPAREQFTFFPPDPKNSTKYGNAALAFYQDRSGLLWVARGEGVLSRYDGATKTFASYTPNPSDPRKLKGGDIPAILEDRTGTLWLGASDGLYRLNPQDESFARYTEGQGLPSSTIQGILEDNLGRLWLSTNNGISRFDPQTETFRNYQASDGLQGDAFSQAACAQGIDGEMFFGGSNGFNAFFPEEVRDNSYIPPVVITSFKIFNEPVSIGANSVLKRAIQYTDSLTLSYRDNIFSFEFAALSYANSQKNLYRYRLEGLEPRWNEVSSKQRIATYTNLDPGKYIFHVQGANSDGVWNEVGVSLPILITPPWWRTTWFLFLIAAGFLALLWAAYQLRVRQLRQQFAMSLEARVSERTRIARELHDTLLQSLQALLFQFQAARNLFAAGSERAMQVLDSTIDKTEQAIAEGRDAIRDIRSDTVAQNALPELLTMAGTELAESQGDQQLPTFAVTVEGERRRLSPIIQEEIYRIALELLRNAFRHANAHRIETEIRYDDGLLRLRIRDDGKGMDTKKLQEGSAGHWGLRGVRERAERIGARLDLWSEPGAGTEFQLVIPAQVAYDGSGSSVASRLLRKVRGYAHRN